MSFPPGTMLGRYRIDAILGQGQSGIVYCGFDTALERTVAIKCLRLPATAENSEEITAGGFFEEAKVIGQLSHPHVTAVYDMGSVEGLPYFVLEYVSGETLKARLARPEPSSTVQILKVLVMLARALHYVHQRGILHGDVKPGNILITPLGTPKIMDFGVSRRSQPSKPACWSLAGEGMVSGTPGYLAPEQLTADIIDVRADIFSLGVIAYEWLAGRKPFWGENPDATLQAVLDGKPAPLDEVSGCDPGLSRIIHQAIAVDPKDRFSSADALADALEVFLERGPERLPVPERPESIGTESSHGFSTLARRNLYFADFTDKELGEVRQLSREGRYQIGDVIVEEGTGGSTMFLVVEGLVSVRKRSGRTEVELKQISAGGGFGEMAVISQMPRSATVVALRPTKVFVISGAVLRLTSPVLSMKLYRNIAASLSERLRDVDQKLADVLQPSAAV